MCFNINGQWHCSAPIQFWFGRQDADPTAGGRPEDVYREWYYSPGRWGVMAGYEPAEGEIVGIFAASGNLRGAQFNQASCPNFCERTNVALVPFSTQGAAYNLSSLRVPHVTLRGK